MTTATARMFLLAAVASALSFGLHAAAPEPAAPAPIEQPAAASPEDQPLELETPRRSETPVESGSSPGQRGSFNNVVLHFGDDAHLPAGRRAGGVIAIGGSASSDGEVSESVVSIVGNTRVNGPANEAVAVFGNTYVNGHVQDTAVAVFGDVELGSRADVQGDVIAIGGSVIRDPAAVVHGAVQEISFPLPMGHFDWLRTWLKHCLLLGRPLALEPGLGWAWSLAFGFLALYVCIALIYPSAVEKCVATLETRPGHSLLAALLSMFLSPVLMVMLAITVIGVALIPFVWIALFCAGIFGKVVVLAVLGRRLTRFISAGPLAHIAFPVFLGGLILIGLYLVPVLGFILYKLTELIGVGVVMYVLILAFKAHREQSAPPFAAAGGPTMMSTAVSAEGGTPTIDAKPYEYTYKYTYTDADAVPSAASPSAVQELPRAGFWIRMGALFVDGLLIAIALGALHDSGDTWLLVLAAYGAIMWKLKGTTIGGILCNLQVVRSDGREIDWPTAGIRALSCFLSLGAVGLGFLWIVFDDNRQAWHDKIAGTLVVRVPKGVSLT
ncbi:MAG: RDD family protein [Steroidobacteraceae bacterium]